MQSHVCCWAVVLAALRSLTEGSLANPHAAQLLEKRVGLLTSNDAQLAARTGSMGTIGYCRQCAQKHRSAATHMGRVHPCEDRMVGLSADRGVRAHAARARGARRMPDGSRTRDSGAGTWWRTAEAAILQHRNCFKNERRRHDADDGNSVLHSIYRLYSALLTSQIHRPVKRLTY